MLEVYRGSAVGIWRGRSAGVIAGVVAVAATAATAAHVLERPPAALEP